MGIDANYPNQESMIREIANKIEGLSKPLSLSEENNPKHEEGGIMSIPTVLNRFSGPHTDIASNPKRQQENERIRTLGFKTRKAYKKYLKKSRREATCSTE